jgi:hypothetical protein
VKGNIVRDTDNISVNEMLDLVRKMGGAEGLARLKLGHTELVTKRHCVFMNKVPYLPKGWSIQTPHFCMDEHLFLEKVGFELKPWRDWMEEIFFDSNHIAQTRPGELNYSTIPNAKVLDYYRAHPDIISKEWKKDEQGRVRYMFFPGTIYQSSDGKRCFRGFYWNDRKWKWTAISYEPNTDGSFTAYFYHRGSGILCLFEAEGLAYVKIPTSELNL